MNSAVRWIVLPVFLFAIVTEMPVWAGDPPMAAKSTATKSDASAAPKARVLVTISKETTYITDPLRKDGYPDYVAALNQICSKGVTPENNAAVLFWQAVGPSSIDKKDREAYFKMLGIPPLPEKGDYLIDLDDYVKRQKAPAKSADSQSQETGRDPVWDMWETASKRPWSKQEFPLLAGWLEANKKPLALLVEASKRSRRYDPMVANTDSMVAAIPLWTVHSYRTVARALPVRATLRVHEGKVNEAWEDLMACHRLARLVGQGPTLIDTLVGITIGWIACAGDQTMLQHANLTAAQIMKMRDDLAKLPPILKMADKIDVTERFFGLDCVSGIAREGFGSFGKRMGGGEEPKGMVKSLIDFVPAASVDWDIILRMANSWYDRFADAFRKPTHTERKKALDTIDADIKSLAISTRDLKSLGLSMLFSPRKAISERIGQAFVCLLLPALSACSNADDRWATQFELTKLAFALAAYRAEHGSYPAKLAELAPKYVADVPKDMFNDADLHYRPEGAGYLLYSVGVNGKDDGGKSYEDAEEGEAWDDLVVRMPAAAKRQAK